MSKDALCELACVLRVFLPLPYMIPQSQRFHDEYSCRQSFLVFGVCWPLYVTFLHPAKARTSCELL